MARSSGTHSRPVASYVSGTVIDETKVNAEMDDFSSEITNSIACDGQSTITSDIPMATYHFTGLGAGSNRTDSANIGNIADGTHCWITGGGTADVITGGMSPAITAYTTGMRISFVAPGTNTTNVTLNVDSVGAKAITKHGTTALVAGDIKSGQIVTVVYDGTRFLLETPSDKVTDNILDGTTNFTKLDVDNIVINGNDISTTSGDLTLSATSTVVINTDLDVDNININGNTISSIDAAGDINITPNTTGDLVLDGQKWPQADGSANQILQTDGSGQLSWNNYPRLVLLETQTASASATIDLETTIDSTYSEYLITLRDVVPASDGVELDLRVKDTTYQSDAGDYAWGHNASHEASPADSGSASDDAITITLAGASDSCGSAAGESGNWDIRLFNPASTSLYKHIMFEGSYLATDTVITHVEGTGFYQSNTNAITGIRFLFSSGNIASGTFKLFGVVNS